jgi:hypothetical protein
MENNKSPLQKIIEGVNHGIPKSENNINIDDVGKVLNERNQPIKFVTKTTEK